MPNIKSAEKRMRQTVGRTENIKSKKSRIISTRRVLTDAIQVGDKVKAQTAFNGYCSALDKGVKSGVITSNKADRGKSRASKALTQMEA